MVLTKERQDEIINQCTVISGWAVSCETLKQLETVDNFFMKLSEQCYGSNHIKVIFNLGFVSGVIKLKRHMLKKNRK